METDIYVGLDISKEDIYVGSTMNKNVFSVENSLRGFKKILKFLKDLQVRAVVMEASGGYERDIFYFLLRYKIPSVIVNPKNVRRYAEAMGVLAKTDKIDVKVISAFALAIKPTPITAIDEGVEELKDLVKRREQILNAVKSEKNRLSKSRNGIRKSIERVISFLEDELKKIENEMDELIKSRKDFQEKIDVIESIPGAGRVLSMAIVALMPEMGKIPKKQLSSLIGIAPYPKESGKLKKKGRITGGRSLIRKVLYMATVSAIKFNKEIRAFYLRLKGKNKPGRVCIVACMNKFLRIINALLKNNVMWDEDFLTAKAA